MRKTIKKGLATLLVAGLGVSALAGCTSAPKTSSMTDVMNVASELDSYSYSYELSASVSETESITAKLYGNCTKDAVSMSVKVKTEGIEDMDYDIDAKDIIICTKDALYVNVSEIEDEFLSGMDLGTYGVDADWIMLDYGMEMELETSTELSETFLKDFEAAYEDLIDEDDGEYTLVIDDNDTAKEFLEATATMLEENGEDWADLMVSMYDDFDYQAFISNFMNSLFMEMNKTFDLGMSASEISEGVDEALAEIDFSELEVEASDYAEKFDELASEINDNIEYVDLEGAEIEITAYQDGSEYVTKAKVVYEDSYSEERIVINVTSTIVSEDVKVSVPAEDDVQTVEELICVMLEQFNGELTAEDVEELMSSMDDLLYDIDLDSMSEMVVPDVDYDDYLDDYDWDEEW